MLVSFTGSGEDCGGSLSNAKDSSQQRVAADSPPLRSGERLNPTVSPLVTFEEPFKRSKR